MDDYDFYGSQSDMEYFKNWMGEKYANPEWLTDKEGNTHYVNRLGLSISIMKHGKLSDLFLEAPDTVQSSILGHDTKVIGPYTQLAIKLGYFTRSDFHKEKNANDVEYWLNVLDPENWCPIHRDILICMRERSFKLFNKEPSPYAGSEEEALLNRFNKGAEHGTRTITIPGYSR